MSYIQGSAALAESRISVIVVVMTFSFAQAQALEQELTSLKDKLSKQLVAKGRKKVAALDFTDLQGRRNELGRYLAEQLTVELVSAEGISVLDRANLKSILDEHKLTEEGLVKPENAKKLGQFSGVDAVIIGNVSMADTEIVVLVKAISTETAEIVAAGRGKFTKTSELQQLLANAIIPTATGGPAGGSGGVAASNTDATAIASKEAGSLRLTLRKVAPLKDREGKQIEGVICSFDLTNLDLQKSLTVATVCQVSQGGAFVSRSKLADSNGRVWPLREANGLPYVACGNYDDPNNIARIVRSGKQVDSEGLAPFRGAENLWHGDFLSIGPGVSKRITMTFRDDRGEGVTAIDAFQFESQLLIGESDPSARETKYRSETVLFDKITMAKAEEK